jgi:hypothetical protein
VLRTDTADHEAAHVVVGVAVGLRLKLASICHGTGDNEGVAWFIGSRVRNSLALGLMYCAGAAWEARKGDRGHESYARGDLELARKWLGLSKSDVRAGVRVASELLDARRALHARVARELCDRDLTHKDVRALVLG